MTLKRPREALTALEAAPSGVPLSTLLGGTFVGRMAASMLHAVGLPELVAESLSGYEAQALRVATDTTFCRALKQRLARNRATFPLFDKARFARNIENAYATMWHRSSNSFNDDANMTAILIPSSTLVFGSRSATTAFLLARR